MIVRLLLFFFCFSLSAQVTVGLDRLLDEPTFQPLIAGKRVGLITNHTALCRDGKLAMDRMHESRRLVALFAPEHGLTGTSYAADFVEDGLYKGEVRVYSLHGATRRPTKEMLKNVDVLVFDIQDIGSRSYTYISTLFYAMEEAAKAGIPVIVADRPNPMGGLIVDGVGVEEKCRSFLGYIDIPYCHGMTVGELALYFNDQYRVGCDVTVVPMSGWHRSMLFYNTGLIWVPTSPNIPEVDTPLFYSMCGIVGEIKLINNGVGYTLPFKVVAAPWIDAEQLAEKLNQQRFPGVTFLPIHLKPFFGPMQEKLCHGVQIVVTDPKKLLPVQTQYLIVGMLKTLYRKQFDEAIAKVNPTTFGKISGKEEVLRILKEEKYAIWKLRALAQEDRQRFMASRARYLLYPE